MNNNLSNQESIDSKEFAQKVVRKVSLRLLPYLVLAYILNFVDRVNLGFAALQMNQELAFSATVFGWGAGILFIGYFFFGVPSNMALNRIGARRWLPSIMIIWGLISTSMIFVRDPISFYFIRFLLGAAEAGFFPGVILYLSLWIPKEYLGRINSRFMFAQPVALTLGSMVSGWLLQMDGFAGMAGWRWMFILEGIPSSLIGIVGLFYLTDLPKNAKWLNKEESEWLQSTLDRESALAQATSKSQMNNKGGFAQALSDNRVWLLSIIYFCMVIGVYGVNMWMPQIIKGFSEQISNAQIGLIGSIPFIAASIGMLAIGMSSDKRKERKWHVTLSTAIAGLTLLISAFTQHNPVITIILLSISCIGMYGCMPIFLTIPSAFLAGSTRAAGIGIINAIGNLGGFAGPILVGIIKDSTGSFINGLVFLGTCVIVGSLLVYLPAKRSQEKLT